MTESISSEAGDNSPRQGLTWPREVPHESALLVMGFLKLRFNAILYWGGVSVISSNTDTLVLCFTLYMGSLGKFFLDPGPPGLWERNVHPRESALRQDGPLRGASRELGGCHSVFTGEHYFLCKTPPPSIRQGWGIHNYFVKSNFLKLSESFCLHLYPQADFYRGLSTVVVKDTGLFYFAKASAWWVFHAYTHTHTHPHSPVSLLITGSRDEVSGSLQKAFWQADRGAPLH